MKNSITMYQKAYIYPGQIRKYTTTNPIIHRNYNRRLLRSLNKLQGFDHNNTVSSDDHHAYLIFLIAISFNSVVDDQIHKLVKPTKRPNHHAVNIQL
ncbi:hypothetical protein GIB67_011654, partial [Kingdonia uniflora]